MLIIFFSHFSSLPLDVFSSIGGMATRRSSTGIDLLSPGSLTAVCCTQGCTSPKKKQETKRMGYIVRLFDWLTDCHELDLKENIAGPMPAASFPCLAFPGRTGSYTSAPGPESISACTRNVILITPHH